MSELTIHLSQAAIDEINRIKSKHSNPQASFRLEAQSGGCSGFYYVLRLDETAKPEDVSTNFAGIEVLVDLKSLQYLNGLSLDYSEDLMGGGFRFHNPNATSNCGCGNSFSVS